MKNVSLKESVVESVFFMNRHLREKCGSCRFPVVRFDPNKHVRGAGDTVDMTLAELLETFETPSDVRHYLAGPNIFRFENELAEVLAEVTRSKENGANDLKGKSVRAVLSEQGHSRQGWRARNVAWERWTAHQHAFRRCAQHAFANQGDKGFHFGFSKRVPEFIHVISSVCVQSI
jgi:hypothetical protein